MIEVEKLTRRFPGLTAVDGVSFHVGKGWITGFLGPNGAGKTTTLRMLSAYMPPTSGTARLAGYDVYRQSLEVRRRIGYLPENAPLYPDMRVQEYLLYRASLKGVPRHAGRKNLDRVLDLVRIRDHRRRIIGQLSKGYRQRVGLADALIHDPPILLLDEPTSGLDPNQIREMRQTLKDLAAEKTLVLSTHILPEVETVCDHLVVIHGGKIVMKGALEELRKGFTESGPLSVEGRGGEPREMEKALGEVKGVRSVAFRGNPESPAWSLDTEKDTGVRERIYRLFTDRGWTLLELVRKSPTLEQMFWKVTSGGDLDPVPGEGKGSE